MRQLPEHSRWDRSDVYTSRADNWVSDPDFSDVGCFVCDRLLALTKGAIYHGFLDDNAKIGVVIRDLTPYVKSEQNKIVKAELARGFACVPKRHPLHMKGMTHTFVFCRTLLHWMHRNRPERELLDYIGRMELTLLVMSANKRSQNVVSFRQRARTAMPLWPE